jgi:hypothetical protein
MKNDIVVKHLRRIMGIHFAMHRRGRTEVFWFVIVILLVVVLLLALMIIVFFPRETVADVFVGVEVGYDNVDDFVRFVDEIEEYVNLIVIGSLNITTNAINLIEVGDYLHSKGLYFVPFMFFKEYLVKADFFQVAKERWGEQFLGLYLSDEAGGRQIDLFEPKIVDEAESYTDAATKFVANLEKAHRDFFAHYIQPVDVTTFTSDYALYWFDYEAGWDVVFTEYGWNVSRQLQTALGRGAANMHNKEWGAIVTWTYQNPPYIEATEMLYSDLVLAYNNGAKYILVFNYPTNITEYGILTREHLESIKKFWDYVNDVPQPTQASKTAYVLPKYYGYGFREQDDRIWGLWSSDKLSTVVWDKANSLSVTYGEKLDIIYDTTELSLEQHYEKLIFWNGTIIQFD